MIDSLLRVSLALRGLVREQSARGVAGRCVGCLRSLTRGIDSCITLAFRTITAHGLLRAQRPRRINQTRRAASDGRLFCDRERPRLAVRAVRRTGQAPGLTPDVTGGHGMTNDRIFFTDRAYWEPMQLPPNTERLVGDRRAGWGAVRSSRPVPTASTVRITSALTPSVTQNPHLAI